LLLAVSCAPRPAAEGPRLLGRMEGSHDVSGLTFVGRFLVVVTDESNKLYVLGPEGDDYRVHHELALNATGEEIDLEGVAADGTTVYAIGSHSWTRKQPPGPRDKLFRFTLDEDGTPGPLAERSLRAAIDADPVLSKYVKLPAKENGVDIEGLAVRGGELFVGFRGPVLDDGSAVVLRCSFDDPAASVKRLTLPLKGMGIRDLAATKGGLLVLAGPVGEGMKGFALYEWDTKGPPRKLADVEAVGKGKPEGVAVVSESDEAFEVLIAYDGLPNGGVRKRRFARK
jgi:hypothetical protein